MFAISSRRLRHLAAAGSLSTRMLALGLGLGLGLSLSLGLRPAAAQEGQYPDLSALQPDTVVAVVNGNPLNFAQIEYAYRLLPGGYTDLPLEQILPQVIQLVIEQRLLAEEAAKANLHKQVDYLAALQFQADRLLQETYIDIMMAEQLTDEAIEIAYTVYATQLPLEERVRARHILIKPTSNDEAEVRAALQEAQSLIQKLDEGADFAALAAEHSDDEGSAAKGGDLGFFPLGRMVEPFEETAFALDVGAYTPDAVASPFGFHVIEVLDRTTMKPPLAEVRSDLIAQLEAQRLSLKLEELRAAASIETIIEATPEGEN